MPLRVSPRPIVFATLMGSLSFLMQIAVSGIPIGMGKIELADIPAVLGAVFTGPVGGMITGFLYGIGSPSLLALLPSEVCGMTLMGYMSKNLKLEWKAIPISRILFVPVLATILYSLTYLKGTPFIMIWLIGLSYNTPGALISIPLYFALKKRMSQLIEM